MNILLTQFVHYLALSIILYRPWYRPRYYHESFLDPLLHWTDLIRTLHG